MTTHPQFVAPSSTFVESAAADFTFRFAEIVELAVAAYHQEFLDFLVGAGLASGGDVSNNGLCIVLHLFDNGGAGARQKEVTDIAGRIDLYTADFTSVAGNVNRFKIVYHALELPQMRTVFCAVVVERVPPVVVAPVTELMVVVVGVKETVGVNENESADGLFTMAGPPVRVTEVVPSGSITSRVS